MDATYILKELEKKVLDKHYKWSLFVIGNFVFVYGFSLILNRLVPVSEISQWLIGLYVSGNIIAQWRMHVRMIQRMKDGVYGSKPREANNLAHELAHEQNRIGTPGPKHPWRRAARLVRLAKLYQVSFDDLRKINNRRRSLFRRLFRF